MVIAQPDEARPGDVAERAERQALRPLPRPDHVSDPLGPGRGDRLRRPRPRPRRAEVPQLARDAGLQQGARALRPVRGTHGRSASAAMPWSSRATWTSSPSPRRASRTRSRRSARRAPPSTCKSWFASPTRSSSASTATPPAGAPPDARARGEPAARRRHAHLPLPLPARRARPRQLRARARRRGVRAGDRRGGAAVAPDPRAAPAKTSTSPPPKGRARFLANGRPLWSALPDGMLKRQLLGEIRVARRLAGRRARRRLAGRGRAARRARRARARARRPAGAAAPRRAAADAPAGRPHRLDAAARERLVGDAERRRPRGALRPARLARRAVPLPRPPVDRARRPAVGGAARADRPTSPGRRRRSPWSTPRIRRSSRSPRTCRARSSSFVRRPSGTTPCVFWAEFDPQAPAVVV